MQVGKNQQEIAISKTDWQYCYETMAFSLFAIKKRETRKSTFK